MPFEIDPRIESTTFRVAELDQCDIRLNNDARWPWAILVPRIENAFEWHRLDPAIRVRIDEEVCRVADALEAVVKCQKLNLGSLGNMVPQLHLHVVGRNAGDPNWPNPVWGFGKRTEYSEEAAATLIASLRSSLMTHESIPE